jgi:hypothetical protein
MLSVLEDLIAPYDGALARLWLARVGDLCSGCPMRPQCPDRSRCLHLVTSAGVTHRLDGPFRRIPIGLEPIGGVMLRRAPHVARQDLERAGLAPPAWLALHGIKSFVAVPVERAPDCLGVLALFSRRELAEAEVQAIGATARLLGLALVPGSQPGVGRTLFEIEREAIEHTLVATRGRVSGPRGAARILGLKPTTLHSRMKKLGVRRDPRG